MFKSKLLMLLPLFVSVSAMSQTIDSLASGNSPAVEPPSVNPAAALQTPLGQPYPGSKDASTNAPQGPKRGTHLVGVFAGPGGSGQAEFIVDGRTEYYGVGDIMKGGWEVSSVTSKTVNLKKCSEGKRVRCSTKKYAFQGG